MKNIILSSSNKNWNLFGPHSKLILGNRGPLIRQKMLQCMILCITVEMNPCLQKSVSTRATKNRRVSKYVLEKKVIVPSQLYLQHVKYGT